MFVLRKLCFRYYKNCLLVCLIIVLCSIFCCVTFLQNYNEGEERLFKKHNFKLYEVHWFNFMSADYNRLRECSETICRFTAGDDPLKLQNAKAILFYGSEMDIEFPLPRQPQQLWALLHEESLRNVRYLSSPTFIQHFNITSTMSRFSDLPLTLLYLPSLEALTSQTYLKSIQQKKHLQRASVVFIQTDCNTATGREQYVQELMKYMPVDSYGSCLNNKKQPASLSENFLNNLYSAELLHLLSGYKFTLAIENAACEDYITEKFWRPLIAGSIPIYFGSPSIRDWAPNNKSVIYVEDFKNAKALAEFLLALDNNDIEYSTYLQHKSSNNIDNERLKQEYAKRTQEINYMQDDFECYVCHTLSQIKAGEIRQANIKHYDCAMPPAHPPLMEKFDNDWPYILHYGQCEAHVLDQLFRNNTPYKKSDVNNLVLKRLQDNYSASDVRCAKL